MQIGTKNLISDVAGILVGNAHDVALGSGVTVVLPDPNIIKDQGFIAAIDVRGGAPGTRETALLEPSCTVNQIHAICLSGGSAWGLNATDGVMRYLKEKGHGLKWQDAIIPIVPTAILFDLLNGGNKTWQNNPYPHLAYQAAQNADSNFEIGSFGAGFGAKAGAIKGGLGSASFTYKKQFTVGSLVAANPVGSVLMPGTSCFWAWPFEQGQEFGGARPDPSKQSYRLDYPFDFIDGVDINQPDITNTSLAIIATDLILTKTQATRIAMAAQDGLARAIRPVHTPLDGDLIFVISTGLRKMESPTHDMAKLAMISADCLSRSVARAIFNASSYGKFISYQEKFSKGLNHA